MLVNLGVSFSSVLMLDYATETVLLHQDQLYELLLDDEGCPRTFPERKSARVSLNISTSFSASTIHSLAAASRPATGSVSSEDLPWPSFIGHSSWMRFQLLATSFSFCSSSSFSCAEVSFRDFPPLVFLSPPPTRVLSSNNEAPSAPLLSEGCSVCSRPLRDLPRASMTSKL